MRRGGRFHSIRFPNESDEYRTARDALIDEEIALRRAHRDWGPELAYR